MVVIPFPTKNKLTKIERTEVLSFCGYLKNPYENNTNESFEMTTDQNLLRIRINQLDETETISVKRRLFTLNNMKKDIKENIFKNETEKQTAEVIFKGRRLELCDFLKVFPGPGLWKLNNKLEVGDH